MIDAIKSKLVKASNRASYTINLTVIALLAFAYLAVHTGHARADVQLDGWSIGGGTSEHAAREQKLAALETALPVAALSPAKSDAPPIPQRKPAVH
jgi:hypothetical protein